MREHRRFGTVLSIYPLKGRFPGTAFLNMAFRFVPASELMVEKMYIWNQKMGFSHSTYLDQGQWLDSLSYSLCWLNFSGVDSRHRTRSGLTIKLPEVFTWNANL